MRPIAAALAVALVSFVARSSSADEPQTYTLPLKEPWKPGDVVTRHRTDHRVQKQTIKTQDGTTVREQASDITVDYRAVVKVLEVDAENGMSKRVVHFTSWSRKDGDVVDRSLEGKHVEV